jgi:hypothetical protein
MDALMHGSLFGAPKANLSNEDDPHQLRVVFFLTLE